MPEVFNEAALCYALSSRPEDAKQYMQIFRPEWLLNKEYQSILAEIYNFTIEHETPPSLNALDQIYKDRDPSLWEQRYRPIIDEIRKSDPDLSTQIYVLSKAREVAICRSFEDLIHSQDFLTNQVDLKGNSVLKSINSWMLHFLKTPDEQTLNIREAIEDLVKSVGFNDRNQRITTGIKPIDEWTRGGLKPTQLGIFLAPTASGKSAVLLNIAYNVAAFDQLPVWFVTNELTIREQAERFLSRMTKIPLDKIQDDPIIAYDGLGRHWTAGLDQRLRITAVSKKVSALDLEAMMIRWKQISGWAPAVLALDFMERMKPIETLGVSRAQEWVWLQAIAEDLKNLAKRHNILIWTAGQTNRSGYDNDQAMRIDMAQSSIRHLQESDATIGMRQVEAASGKRAMEFFSLKMRHSKLESMSRVLDLDLETMYITRDEVKKAGKQTTKDADDDDDGPSVPKVTKFKGSKRND